MDLHVFTENEEMWKFAPIPSFEDATFNKVLEKFHSMGVSGLVRENIQNSLDAKLNGSDKPVKVKIEIGKIKKKDIPGIEDVLKRIRCLKGYNSQTNETIAHMNEFVDKEETNYISFEDMNTKGLTGAKNGQSNSNEDTWGIYAYNKGVHAEEEDQEKEKVRGGSHGIGKISSNAASDIHMMCFANCDAEGNQHLGGTIQLIEHLYNEKYYRSTGYLTDIKRIDDHSTKYYPYENKFHKVFEKNTRGLKIIIPYLREHFNDEKEIIKSVCDSFFVSILQGNLEVEINKKTIDKYTIKDFITNSKYYEQDFSEIREDFTPIYLETYEKMAPVPLEIKSLRNEYEFNLYFQYNEEIRTGRAAIIRTVGMKIEDKKIKNNVRSPFNAIIVPMSSKEDEFLKSLENESHIELSHSHIKNQYLAKDAKRFINNISREMAKIIDEEVRRRNPTDGLMDTGDIIYTVERQLKQTLENEMQTININVRDKNKTVTKIKTGNRKLGEKRKKGDTKKARKRRTRTGLGTGDKKVSFLPHNDCIDRIVLDDSEIIKIDFSNSEEIIEAKVCDLSMALIDGQGNEYDNEFNIKENYSQVIDSSTNTPLMIEDNMIKNIKISDKEINLRFTLNEQYNKNLKFIYFVEV